MKYTLEMLTGMCDRLADQMMEKGLITPAASLEVRSGRPGARLCMNWALPGENWPSEYEFLSGETIALAMAKGLEWIAQKPTGQEKALKDALDLTAKALEASRKAGLDTGEGAAFVAQLEAMMKRLSSNAIISQ
jgi:hypothetical protein